MKLRKTWIGICVWVIYLVGMIFAIGVTGFVSGLFSSYDRYLVAGGTVVACLIVAFILGLIGNKIGDKLNQNENFREFKKPVWLEILIPVIIIVTAFFTYNNYSLLVNEFSGNVTLYDSAVVAIAGEETTNIPVADTAYVIILRTLMSFLGNSLNVVSSMNLALRILMILFLYVAIRSSIGMLPAIVCGCAFVVIPSFGYSLRTIDSAQLIYTAIAFLTMLVVLYVKGFESRVGSRWFYKIFSILLGGLLGLMIYLDAASAAVIVFLLSAWALADMYCETFNICINEILILLSGVASFIGMLIYEGGGTEKVPDTYYRWTWKFYGYNDSPWLLMVKNSLPNTYFALAVLVLALIPVFVYLSKERCEKITPWIMFSVLVIFASVLLGDTAACSEVMIIAAFIIFISCGFACFAYIEGEDDVEEEYIEDEEESEESEDSENPVITEESENAENTENSEDADDEQKDEAEDTDIKQTDENMELSAEDNSGNTNESLAVETSNDSSADADNKSADETIKEDKPEVEKKEEKPRFVPEGMVLPTGDEDEEDLVPNFNMNRPEMAEIGVLSVGQKNEVKKEESKTPLVNQEIISQKEPEVKKDDFDFSLKPGDDFDI